MTTVTDNETQAHREDALRRLAAIEARVAPIRSSYAEEPALTVGDRGSARRNAAIRISAIEARSAIRGNAR